MTVYFAQQPSPNRSQPDLSTAEEYGEVRFVFPFDYPVSLRPDMAYGHAKSILDGFDPEKDFVGDCGGDKMALGIVTHILSDLKCIPFLRWNRWNGGRYEMSRIGPKPS